MKPMFEDLEDYHDLNDIDFSKEPYLSMSRVSDSITTKPLIRCMFFLSRHIEPVDGIIHFTIDHFEEYLFFYERRKFNWISLSLLVNRMLEINETIFKENRVKGLYKLNIITNNQLPT